MGWGEWKKGEELSPRFFSLPFFYLFIYFIYFYLFNFTVGWNYSNLTFIFLIFILFIYLFIYFYLFIFLYTHTYIYCPLSKINPFSQIYIYIYIFCCIPYIMDSPSPINTRQRERQTGVYQSAWHHHVWYHLCSGWIVTSTRDSQLSTN